MAMTVRMLVSKLRKLPQTAHVVWRDHDQGIDELNAYLHHVEAAPDELYLARKVVEHDFDPKRKLVVLSP